MNLIYIYYYHQRKTIKLKKRLKNIRTWPDKLNIIINIINTIQFINIIKIKINIITIEKNIYLILMVKSIIIVIINLGQASPSRPKKLGFGKGRLTQVA